QFASISFDASVSEIATTLTCGATLQLASTDKFLPDEQFIQLINRQSITHVTLPPSFLAVLPHEKLSGLETMVVAGETCSSELVKKWSKGRKFINAYGPTESTVCATLTECQADNNAPPIGKPIANTQITILDIHHNPTPLGIPGELCIAGAGLARGYLNRPELTKEKFELPPTLYHTGDLARWMPDGNIEFLGRTDDQVKIRGYRIEPGEIEAQLRRLDRVSEAVVPALNSGGDKLLCGYVTLSEEADDTSVGEDELKMYLESCLPSYMVPAWIVILDEMPLTSNGKLDRNALPEPDREGVSGDYAAPESGLARTLVRIWADVLKIEPEGIGVDDDFFRLGGHSLRATVMVSKIHRSCGVKLQLADVFQSPTIRALAARINEAGLGTDIYASIRPAEKREYYHASPLQRRIFMLHEIMADQTPYNMPHVITIKGRFESEPFERAFQQLIHRHEILRSVFELRDGVPVQVVREDADFSIRYFDVDGHDIPKLVADFVKPFDLGHAPLLRVSIGKLPDDEHLWLLDMHHIISDGVSVSILTREFMQLYEGRSITPLRIQYKDVCQWRHTTEGKNALMAQEMYWLNRFEGEIPVLNMITDFPRPAVQSFEGDRLFMEIKEPLLGKIKRILETTGTTLYMLLLTVLNILLSRYTGQEDIVVGTTVSGRNHADLENLLGMFINPLPIRNYPRRDKTFQEFLLEVKENTLGAYENQGYHYSDLVEKLGAGGDVSRNPLYDVELILQNIETPVLEISELEFVPQKVENKNAQLDISFIAMESEQGVVLYVVYCTRLYKRETIDRLIKFFQRVLNLVVEDMTVKIRDIEMPHEFEQADVSVFEDEDSDFGF
ncbi:MAG: AMP-binding protein, partial [bacterium]|nr:AMP-binding protein [bacterium]